MKLSTLTKHDVVDGVPMHFILFHVRGEQFDVASATVNALLMFYSQLEDERLALVAEVVKTG